MIGLIGFFCFLLNLCVLLYNREKGVALYCVLLMVAPVMVISGISIKYEILSVPLLMYIMLTQKSNLWMENGQFFWICWYIWVLFVTAFSPIKNMSENSIEWLTIVGVLRYFLVFFVLTKEDVLQRQFIVIIRATVYVNTLFVFFQAVFSRLISEKWVLELMLQMYGTIGNSGALSIDASLGNMGRFYGAFSTTSYLGTFAVAGMILFFDELRKEFSVNNVVSFGCSAFLGLMSSTKRFYLGIVAILVYYVFVKIIVGKGVVKISIHRMMKFLGLMICVIVGLVIIASNFIDSAIVKYYSSYLIQGRFFESFQTRFSSMGAVESMRGSIRTYFMTGVGMISTSTVNTSDSEFYIILYRSGLIGLILNVLFIGHIFWKFIRTKNITKYMIFGIIIFEFFISTEFYSAMGILFLAFVGGKSEESNMRQGVRDLRCGSYYPGKVHL